MEASATDTPGQEEPTLLIFKLSGSIEHLLINDPQEWLSEFVAEHEREERIARRLAMCPETHSLRFHLEGEDCDETRPFDDLDEAFELGDFLDRVILLHTVQREVPVSTSSGQLEAIVVDHSAERTVERSWHGSETTSKRRTVRPDQPQGTKATSPKSVDAGPAHADAHALADSYIPSYSQDRTLAGSQKPVKHKPTPAGGSRAAKANDSAKPLQGPTLPLKKSHKPENQRREASSKRTEDTLKNEGEARHASRKLHQKDSEGDKLENDTMLHQKTPASEGRNNGKEQQNVSATTKGKQPTRESRLGSAAPQPTKTQRMKKRKVGKVTSDSDYVSGDESGSQSPKKKSKIDKPSLKSSKVGKKAR
ncbi:hypothetical protein KC332_g5469 [Hortaea werneckii]|nr:hypothetical protein KC358_g7132 [Hortaea werneckii]KAI6833317.1 hypothetical protein KC350_g6961 [Hortaea werneckii]KAI6930635.1 hypothetical protein KC348_g7522 [Hortaea werneckii]KAI6935443.1 hypothetical protein KC341_g6935 [Hortaea werneckii]KAI6964790.1 hypothetical protein KC321_g10475 [Hortaea werneckii]